MSVLRCNGRRRKTASAGRSKCSVGAKMGRRGWRRRLSPIAPRWRNGRASRNHSIGQQSRTIVPECSRRLVGARKGRRGWRRHLSPIAPR